ncbi:MAG: ribosome small subunit-dependent GTPase A [Spirochaetaceae bacterium]|nr:ribosome small subunit-dependent GTPase A [Spirochaetaceae bacterium]
MQALVIKGSRNIWTVKPLENPLPQPFIECPIKGKVLKGVEGYYNPLAPGDIVNLEDDKIVSVEPRRNVFSRLNQKGAGSKRYPDMAKQSEVKYQDASSSAPQLLAANIDIVLCMVTPASPPFRPRFLDRLLLQADVAGVPAMLMCNKWDLSKKPAENGIADTLIDIEERLEDAHRLGYPVFRISCKTGEGIEDLKQVLVNKTSVLTGQSGVGKSSFLNTLFPGLNIKTGELNEKYNRGSHTTSQSCLYQSEKDAATPISIIDTPGIRLLLPAGVSADTLILYMREFAPLAGKCSFGMSCTHTVEPGCKILEAVNAGYIHEDRYESFLRIREELKELSR